jgi:archaellum component FlaG (FlaF/FlaG flagellin family)
MKSNVTGRTSIVLLCVISILSMYGCTGYNAEKINQSSPAKESAMVTSGKAAVGSAAAATQSSGPAPLLSQGHPVDWWFVFKFNAAEFPGCGGDAARNCIFGGTVLNNEQCSGEPTQQYRYSQKFVYASSENPSLQNGSVCLGDTLDDPVGATFGQVYNSTSPLYYVIWNDQFYNQPLINGCNNACFAPWGHSKGMVAWNSDGEGFVMQVTTPSWPASGSISHPRGLNEPNPDGNTLGCVCDNDVYLSQHFFALKLNKDDLAKVLQALQNASVVTDPANPQIVMNGGPSDIQALVNALGQQPGANAAKATIVALSSGVQLISKPSNLYVPPWQMVSALLSGMPLKTANWWGTPNPIYSTTGNATIGCWAPGLGTAGPVQIALSGEWDNSTFDLTEYYNHAKFGVSTDPAHTYAIFGDLNQQGALSSDGTETVTCAVSQNARGGTFYAVGNKALNESITSLINGKVAPLTSPTP